MTAGPELSVLVLGVGGNVSQGILKALALASTATRVVAACISPLSLGLYHANRAYISPRADDPAFLEWVIDVCEREGVGAVLSGVEPVLAALSPHAAAIRERTGAVCLVSPPAVLEVGQDKLETCRWLQRNGLGFPRFADAGDAGAVDRLLGECGYPLVAKPCAGKGGQGVALIQTDAELALVAGRPGFVVQEHIGDEANEFTAGCFCDAAGRVRGTLVMRRELREGTTHAAQVGDFPAVRAEVESIVAALRPTGPCNVQLRVAAGRPVAFELNVRFSGTAPARARFGFNEVDAALRHFVLGEPAVDLPLITAGTVLRYWNEMYVPGDAVEALSTAGELDAPRFRRVVVEDWGLDR